MDDQVMWVWWGLTALICAWKLAEAIFINPARMLEWPFLACAMWAYFYCYMGCEAKLTLSAYLGDGISNIGQLMPLLCLVAILIGWAVGTQSKHRIVPERKTYPYFRFWLAGLFFMSLGAIGGISVLRAIDTRTIDYADSSAYWYLLFYVGYPGMAMAVWALFKMGAAKQKYLVFLWIITIAALIAQMFPHVINARRGPLFPCVMILLLVPPMTRRRAPNPFVFCSVLLAAGLVMLLFLQARSVIYNGGSWGEAVQNLSLDTAVSERVKKPEDNEYINNCQLIGTIFKNGKYQYGTGHLSLLAHWIPRAIWKNKPVLGEGSYSFDEMFDDMEKMTGVRLLGTGAAAGGVAESFVQYGIFCPIFWFFLSWGMGAVYVRAKNGDSPRWLFAYVGIICASHWLVTQSLSAAFVPGMFFQAVPIIVFLFFSAFSSGTSRPAKRRRSMQRPIIRDHVPSLETSSVAQLTHKRR